MSPLLFLFAAAILTSSLLKVESFTSLRTSTTVRGPPRLSSLSAQNNVILNDLLASSGNDTAAPSSSSSLTPSSSSNSERRRKILRSALAAPLSAIAASSSLAYPQPAAASTSEKPPPIVPLLTTAKRLRAVPTFAIVDGNGVPFHTYDKDSAGGFGYFFASYTSAEYVLDDARKAFAKAKTEATAKKEEEEEAGGGAIDDDGSVDVPDAWGRAQIATVPLDVAMQLSVKKTQSVAQNTKGGKKFSTFYQVIPSTEDLNAALRIENGPRYSERGRVPLFYVDGLTVPSSDEEGDGGAAARANPVYFRIRDLKAEWQRQHPESELPTVKVRELNETFRAMIRPGGKDESVKNLVFVPIPESVEKSKDSGRSYKLGEMILTK